MGATIMTTPINPNPAPIKTQSWTRASAPPQRPGWYERQHRVVNGKQVLPHPCPYDFFNGIAWIAGFPDQENGDELGNGLRVVSKEFCRDQLLPWRNLPGKAQTFMKKHTESRTRSLQMKA